MEKAKKQVAIIGGGITGLTTAFYLQKLSKEKGIDVDFTLIEASEKLGGKISTLRKDGFVIEKGPDSFLQRKVSAGQLAEDLGIADHLVNNATGQAYVLVGRELHPIPVGAVMGIPTKISPFITTGLFTPLGKLRAAADFILPRGSQEGDQSLGQFFRRRLGGEVVENLIEPLLSGIYAGDIDKLSLQSTFPQFEDVEKKYRSLILGTKATAPKTKTLKSDKKGQFQTLNTGLSSFVEAIRQLLPEERVWLGEKVTTIEKRENEYKISTEKRGDATFDFVVLATSHQVSSNLLSSFGILNEFKDIPSTSVATVAMAYPLDAINQKLEGTGFVVSRNSPYTITACTWTHKKWPHTTPEGKALLRCYVGKAMDEEIVFKSDDEIIQAVKSDLFTILGITEDPDFIEITRWKESMPQYMVGHKERVEKMKAGVREKLPNLYVTGSSFEGLGLPDCINQGKKVVDEILSSL
ncbi:protoporphyrinogen oxidase [Bacillus suaedaesalsae]|uniref:Coproporphyrinogen III oxidase n=1 Tax=Bacillus suaedaesalsae TaxID=2810349 RepID=A0ABS2DFF0_9BACI|nr:protoporphyrinogen oxidase [Bacillus suaedaesalsae]MBM6617185.1 protoporphyrinogen oxidase [Bacillus suaedaesalsae]